MRTLFLVLWIIPFLGYQAQGAIEIYANGHKYDSWQAYFSSKKSTAAVNQNILSDVALHQFYVLGVENRVVGALQDFYETWGQANVPMTRTIYLEQLQEAIEQAVTSSKGPKLLISEPGKVRIMAISPGNSQQK